MKHDPGTNGRQVTMESTWWKRAGLAGFAFFFVKGLAWLVAPLTLYVIR